MQDFASTLSSVPVASLITAGVICLILPIVPLLISFAHSAAVDRQQEVLKGLQGRPVAKTIWYNLAILQISQKLQPPANVRGTHLPLAAMIAVLFFSCILVFGAAFDLASFKSPSLILGANHVYSAEGPDNLSAYQTGTFLAASMAFLGAYIYVLLQLIRRANTNDIYPMTYYFYTVRIVAASLGATLIRHGLAVFSNEIGNTDALLAVVGFAVGWNPTLWLNTLYDRIATKFNLAGRQAAPKPDSLPTRATLELIQGLDSERAERLGELGIDDCETLANQNPFIIWTRTPFELLQILDWLAQAQLFLFVSPETAIGLRQRCVRDIFGLFAALSEKDNTDIAQRLGIPATSPDSLASSISKNLAFARLSEIRDCLVVGQSAN